MTFKFIIFKINQPAPPLRKLIVRIYLVLTLLPFTLQAQSQNLTYKDVEPIFLTRCVSCHRPGDAGPFPLVTYQDVVKRTTFLKEVITERYMPPWTADNHYREFANNRSLPESERNLLLKWLADKAPRGDYKEKSATEKLALLGQTTYKRKPDLTLKTKEPFQVSGNNTEQFVVFKIPFELEAEQSIEAVEFYTNDKKIVHHINYGFYDVSDHKIDIHSGYSMINTTEDKQSDEKLYTQRVLKNKMNYYTGWIPGTSAESYPADFGWILPKRGVILITAHYAASPIAASSIVGVNLFFSGKPIKRPVKVISLGSGGIGEKDISPPLILFPGDITTHKLRVKTQEDQSVMYVWPHMHFLGKEFTAYAVTPESDTIRLVHIPKWDSRWQEMYRLPKLTKVPRGSVIHLECVYDNSAANPFNPNDPPQIVYSFGDMGAKNEMMTLLLIYAPYQPGDSEIDTDSR